MTIRLSASEAAKLGLTPKEASMEHEFDSSMTCNYCGIAEEAARRGSTCSVRVEQTKKRSGKAKVQNTAGQAFAALCVKHGLPEPVPEYRFASDRKWRFDWAWPALSLALEVEGGIWTGGRHTRGAGFTRDMAKYNRATILGWRVLRCTPKDVETGEVLEMLKEAMKENSSDANQA